MYLGNWPIDGVVLVGGLSVLQFIYMLRQLIMQANCFSETPIYHPPRQVLVNFASYRIKQLVVQKQEDRIKSIVLIALFTETKFKK